jgi:hypothetical protein
MSEIFEMTFTKQHNRDVIGNDNATAIFITEFSIELKTKLSIKTLRFASFKYFVAKLMNICLSKINSSVQRKLSR